MTKQEEQSEIFKKFEEWWDKNKFPIMKISGMEIHARIKAAYLAGCNQPPLEVREYEKEGLAYCKWRNKDEKRCSLFVPVEVIEAYHKSTLKSNPVESSNMKTEKLDFIDLIKKLKAVEISHDQSEQGTYESGYEAAKMDTSKIYTQLQSKPVEGDIREDAIKVLEKAKIVLGEDADGGDFYIPIRETEEIIDALLSKFNFTRKG